MQKLASVQSIREFDVAEDGEKVLRPYRIWDAKEKREVLHAYFKNLRHAHIRALCEAAWSKGDKVFELFDRRNGGLRGQYQRIGQQVKFWRSHHALEDE